MGSAQTPVRQPICDSEGFLDFAHKAEQLRVKRLLSEADFAKAAREENTVVLDARGDGSFESLRVKGSKNLPYTSFSEKTLQEISHGGDVDTHLLFAGHNAYRFGEDPFYAGGFIPSVEQLIDRIMSGD
jgi:hypothetical protein